MATETDVREANHLVEGALTCIANWARDDRLSTDERLSIIANHPFVRREALSASPAPVGEPTGGELGSMIANLAHRIDELNDAHDQEVRRLEWTIDTVVTNLRHGSPVDKVLEWYDGDRLAEPASPSPAPTPASPPDAGEYETTAEDRAAWTRRADDCGRLARDFSALQAKVGEVRTLANSLASTVAHLTVKYESALATERTRADGLQRQIDGDNEIFEMLTRRAPKEPGNGK